VFYSFAPQTKAIFFPSQSGFLLFRASSKKIYKVFSGHLVIPDWNHAACGNLL
jgi:hypothetical protein